MLFCSGNTSPAKRRYLQGTFGVMMSYVGLVVSSRIMVNHWHPKGWHLFLAAALPTIPILCLAYIVARYLKDERDEYQRDLIVRSLLWATGVALSLSVFSGFLRSYGVDTQLPAFTEFIAFWITVGLVQAIHSMMNRGGEDE